MSIFSVRLKGERELKKKLNSQWTQGYVAKLVGVARTTYTAYENGTKEPPRDTINRIADIFNVSIDYLEGRTDDRRPIFERIKDIEQVNNAAQTLKLLESKANEMGLTTADHKFQKMLFEALELLRLARSENK